MHKGKDILATCPGEFFVCSNNSKACSVGTLAPGADVVYIEFTVHTSKMTSSHIPVIRLSGYGGKPLIADLFLIERNGKMVAFLSSESSESADRGDLWLEYTSYKIYLELRVNTGRVLCTQYTGEGVFCNGTGVMSGAKFGEEIALLFGDENDPPIGWSYSNLTISSDGKKSPPIPSEALVPTDYEFEKILNAPFREVLRMFLVTQVHNWKLTMRNNEILEQFTK